MDINTKYFGECQVNEEDIIHFESGLPGFLDETRFVILPLNEGTPFFILQSTTTPQLAFIMVSPFLIDKDYDFKIPDPIVQSLKLTYDEQVAVYAILTLHEPFDASTANLKAPVIINTVERLGKQLVLNDDRYDIKTPLNIGDSLIGQED